MSYIKEDFVTTQQPDGRCLIEAAQPGEYKIYWSASPTGFTDDNELEPFTHTTLVENPLGAHRRCYYHIFSPQRYGVAATRVLIPDQFTNLRDAGGYNVADGSAFVKYGTLYRCSVLTELDEAGKKLLDSLGLRSIIDFRTEMEAQRQPDPEVPGAEYRNLSPMLVPDINQFASSLSDLKNLGPEIAIQAYQSIKESYRTMVFSPAYKEMFRMLLDRKTPMLYHCAAGKDRTGIASALILTALGVPRETIYDDYMLTNAARSELIKSMGAKMAQVMGEGEAVSKAIQFFVGVELSSLEGSFEAIEEKYSDIGDYFKQEMDVSANDIEQLKRDLLVPHKID